MAIEISSATPADADAIAALLGDCWASTYSAFLPVRALERVALEWHHPDILRRQLANPDVTFVLARGESGILAGVATATPIPYGGVIDLQRLYVHPSHQRQGIGSQLLRRLLAAFPKAHRFELEVAEANHLGRAFWTKHGFRDVGRSQVHIGDTVLDLVRMSRQVAAN